MVEVHIPEEAVRRAWARAIRHPLRETDAPLADHDDPRVVALPDGVIAIIAVDERAEGRFARVSVRRAGGRPLEHGEAVPLVARVYLAGRFEPFPVECVVGADGRTQHYAIDLEQYKEAKAQDHIARAAGDRRRGRRRRRGGGDPAHRAPVGARAHLGRREGAPE